MTWIEALILLGVGLFTGVINTLAGGGSLITLPLFIFMGLPSSEANATNRIGVFLQSLVAVGGFKSKGVSVFPYAFYVSITAVIGCIIGAYFAIDIKGPLFNKILAVVMVIVIILTVLKPYLAHKGTLEIFTPRRKLLTIVLFFFVGLYGGFIQAGVGFLIIATLTGVHGFNMAKTNSIKSFVIVCYTLVALGIFWWEDQIRWDYGLTLAAGNSAGGWIASRWSVGKDDKWIRLILIVTVVGLAIKLWFFS
ncbi:sulfite exporter TauE/SafE family protein [Marinoscillum sp. 108]|uniref:sulfite exporter TauE/SafE family protein n=1 Tax=Marinoscillum sp. 108 TaxID=2653151 RepID=UPI0012F0D8AE|nr:sulfite exporter TauE/SafE family protein [Marinoscillum sp. 108]VXD10685.1 putative membrane transporter protein [Marinoscillum sp. 108]